MKKHKPNLDEVLKAGKALSKEVVVCMLSGGAHEALVFAHQKWKDAVDGRPDWGPTCTKKETKSNNIKDE